MCQGISNLSIAEYLYIARTLSFCNAIKYLYIGVYELFILEHSFKINSSYNPYTVTTHHIWRQFLRKLRSMLWILASNLTHYVQTHTYIKLYEYKHIHLKYTWNDYIFVVIISCVLTIG